MTRGIAEAPRKESVVGEFVQVVQGRVIDGEALLRRLERWMEDLLPGAAGWLGSTAGVTDDGRAVLTARFESPAAARANSERPEQGEWWAETEKCFDGDVTFHDCEQVDIFLAGGSDRAGFVQVIQGKARDVDAFRTGFRQMDEGLGNLRPDVIGGFFAWHADDEGAFTQVVYFTSEADARAGEAKEQTTEEGPRWEDLLEGAPEFLDLRQPRMFSP